MKIVSKIILVLVLLYGMNALYSAHNFEPFVEDAGDQYLQVQKIKDCDVIYVSASSNFPPENIEERDPRKISQFLSDHFPDLRFEAINKPASHAGIYHPILRMFEEDSEANVFVVTMNLRSFGPSWIDSDLETALAQSAVFYNERPALLNRFLLSLSAYDNLSTQERQVRVMDHWDNDPLPFEAPRNTVTNWCTVEKWGDWRNPKRQLADQFIKQYGFVIDASNPRVQDFDAIVKLAEQREWKIVFNLLAENTEKADELVGEDLTSLMRANADFLIDRYSEMGVSVVDNLELLSSSHFTDKDFPTEHYDQYGREQIAARVAKALQRELESTP